MSDATLESLAPYLELMCCPRCNGEFQLTDGTILCVSCAHRFELSNGIPLLFVPNDWSDEAKDVTDTIKQFYEETPFPNYDDFDNVGSLVDKARRSVFAKLLDDQVPYESRILECGCGTGQMTNFLSVANRIVFGTDMCLHSLRLGQEFKEGNALGGAHFIQMNLFRPVFKSGTFDLVVCNGVLHHTSDPLLGFKSIARLVKPGGFILIGLYHKYGRLITDARRAIFRLSRDRFTFLDPNLRDDQVAAAKRRAWFMDQYKNPHESKHTLGEVFGWLRETGLSFVHSIPSSVPFRPLEESTRIFERQRPGNPVERLIVELGMIAKGSREGGFFTVIAQREAGPI